MKKFIVSIFACALMLLSSVHSALASEKNTWVYVIASGDNLWDITTKFLTKIDYYTKLQKLNNIKYPKKIKPGDVIRIPMQWIKHAPVSARLSYIQGNNQFLRNKKMTPLSSDTQLILGDEIHTGGNGSATVVFADGSEMVLFSHTIISFDHLSAYGETGMVDTRIRVIQGKVETNAKKNKGPGSRLDISTPSAISSVRGTVYRVSNTGKNISTVEVVEGTVAVAGDKPNSTIKVKTGQGTRIEKGIAPTKPVPLLSPPTILTTQEFFETSPKITWAKLEKAEKYNIQISSKKDFKSILWATLTHDTSVIIPNIKDATYFYRITAIDALGIEGLAAKKSLTINLAPQAPQLTHSPQRLLGQQTTSILKWAASSDPADSYKIDIAKDKQFTQQVLSKNVKNTQLPLPNDLAFGDYYWRVSAISGQDKGPTSDPLSFNWATIIEAPTCNISSLSGTHSISWLPIQKNQTMAIEVAKDENFNQIFKSYQLPHESTTVQYSFEKDNYIRCKVQLNNAAIESSWSKTHHVNQIDKGIISMFGFILLIILI